MTLSRRLVDVLVGVPHQAGGLADISVKGIACHPNHVREGWVFVACGLPWAPPIAEGIRFAQGRSPAAIVTDEPVLANGWGGPLISVNEATKAYSAMCANFFGNPARQMTCIAITGTKGKTTTSHLLAGILRAAGKRVGLISSAVRSTGSRDLRASSTTPEPWDLHLLLSEMVFAGVTHVVLELSSIGIAEGRTHGMAFDAVAITNLGRDHLKYHGGEANYHATKVRVFTDASFWRDSVPPIRVLSVDDARVAAHQGEITGASIGVGISGGTFRPDEVRLGKLGTQFRFGDVEVVSSLVGQHNASNIMTAVAVARAMGVSWAGIAHGVASTRPIPGRLEKVVTVGHNQADAYVDYAHTVESVRAVLEAGQILADGRGIVVVLGCGGGGDRSKRSGMLREAMSKARLVIVTSDNPRREEPLEIVRDMTEGLPVHNLVDGGRLTIQLDRRAAIAHAVEVSGPDDVLFILGKGDQSVQIVGDVATPFDDRMVLREEIARAALCQSARPLPSTLLEPPNSLQPLSNEDRPPTMNANERNQMKCNVCRNVHDADSG